MNKRLCSVIFLLLIKAWLAGCNREQSASREAAGTIRIEKGKGVEQIVVFLMIDESGSMYGETGTDPAGLRYEAGNYLVQNLLVKKSAPDAPHQLAVIHFGDQAQASSLVEVRPENAEELARLVRWTGKHLGNTSFIEALKQVGRLSEGQFPSVHNRHLKVVLLTDGTPDDSRRNNMSAADYFAEIAQYIHEDMEDFSLYVVGIDRPELSDSFAQTAAKWKEIVGQDHVFVVQQLKDLYTSYNEAVRSIFEIPSVTPDLVSEDKTFEVQPYLDQMEFHLFTPAGMKLGIYRPDGSLVKADDPGVFHRPGDEYDILIVDAPAPGTWQYKILEGQGEISVVFRNPIPFRLSLLEPAQVFPLGKEMRLRAEFVRENGAPVEELPEYPLTFVGKVVAPDRKEFNIQFLPVDGTTGIYQSAMAVPTDQPGDYLVQLTVKGGHRFSTTSTEKIFVQSFPYVQTVTPQAEQTYARPRDGLRCVVRLQREGENTDPGREFADNPHSLILAQIVETPGKGVSRAVWMDYRAEEQQFAAFIPFQFQERGDYRVAFQLQGTPRIVSELIPASTTTMVSFRIRPNWWDWLRPWLWAIAGVVAVYLFVLAGWLSRASRIVATLDIIRATGESETIFLNNRKWFTPCRIAGYTDEEGTAHPAISIWGRGRSGEAIRLFVGGWLSLLSCGVFSRRRTTLYKGEQQEIRGFSVSLN